MGLFFDDFTGNNIGLLLTTFTLQLIEDMYVET